MSRRAGKRLRRLGVEAVIAVEPARTCELCGQAAETRPYGPNGERVCFPCGMKDEASAKRQMRRHLFGEKDDA